MLNDRKVIYSGMQATGNLTIGNYLGALKNWINFNKEYETFFCVVDLHSITVRQDPKIFRENAYKLLAIYMAAGLEPKKNRLYFQSSVREHSELSWILNCFSYMGELNRMTQFKDKSKKSLDGNINVGLFTYPVLMAADILLYQSDLVPVGADQIQHLELTRDIANRFNSIYGDVFTVPEVYIGKSATRVMSLQDPTKKMSKSDENINGSIYILDDKDTIIRKCKKAVTDSENQIYYDKDNKKAISNLIEIYAAVSEKTIDEVVEIHKNDGYKEFKETLGEVICEKMLPIREKALELYQDKKMLNSIIKENSEEVGYIARKTLNKVKKKIGFVQYY